MSSTSLFGAWLKVRRKAFDIRQEDLADMIGCSPKTIEKIESGERRPSRQVAELLAEHLRVPTDERQAFVRFARFEHDYAQSGDTAPGGQMIDSAPWRSSYRFHTNLPATPAPLIGRDEDKERVAALLQKERVRLLTLIGSPGIGKTSLGIAVAAEMLDRFEDGVFMVPLATISHPDLVVGEIARTLGVQEVGSETIFSLLTRFLQGKRTLLLLDNFEQVSGAATCVADLISACPWLHVLVTSRTTLHVRGERQFEVQPLALPDAGQRPSIEAVAESPAVTLFLERAQGVKPDFELTKENALTVAGICARLEGLPLAIELAAARVKLLPPQALLARLNHPLAILTDGSLDLPIRQQTLRNAIAWSYDLLSDSERTLFARLGVFMGGFTLSAVEAVCNASGDLPFSAVEGVGSLLDKNLLFGERDEGVGGERLFTMLETIREFALERVAESGEIEGIRRLHVEYYLALAEAAEAELASRQQVEWLYRLEQELENLRAAVEYSLTQAKSGETETAVRLTGALWRFWGIRGYITEGRGWLDRALGLGRSSAASKESEGPSPSTPSSHRAEALMGAANLARVQGELDIARSLIEESVSIRRKLGDKRGLAYAINSLGLIAKDTMDLTGARSLFEESLALFRELGDKGSSAMPLQNLVTTYIDEGDYDEARAFAEESLALYREFENKAGIQSAVLNLGVIALAEGDAAGARLLYEESLDIARELGYQEAIALSLLNLGDVALAQENCTAARKLYDESLSAFRELGLKSSIAYTLSRLGLVAHDEGSTKQARILHQEALALARQVEDKYTIACCLEGLSEVAGDTGQHHKAARLLGAAKSLREVTGFPVPSWDRARYDRNIAAGRAQLGEKAFTAACAEGQGIGVEQSITYAMETRP